MVRRRIRPVKLFGSRTPHALRRKDPLGWGVACPVKFGFLFIFPLLWLSAAAEDFPAVVPEAEGMRSEVLVEMSQRIRAEDWDIRSVLVLRHGRMVLEWQSGGVTRDHHHNVFSITKTVVATLAGVALDRGVIASESATLGALFPESAALRGDPAKAGITLAHLLTMRSGLPVTRANQPSGPARELFDQIHEAPDRLDWMLTKMKPRANPGTEFRYNNVDPALVLAAVEERSGERALDFANRHLFEALDFKNARWVFADKQGRVPGGYGLRLRAIDLAKLGQLHLRRGMWNDRRLLSTDWIRHATSDLHGDGYGCFWWVEAHAGSYAAKGVRGQRLVVHPKHGLVFVILSDLPPDQVQPVTATLERDYILKAIASEGLLAETPASAAALRRELGLAASHVPSARASAPASRLPQR